jgi:eukaryotic-like serine/threonine-protein kinase
MSKDRTGQVIANRYRLVALIERGGQSEVYRAQDLIGHDEVAIKVLSQGLAADSLFRERMYREALAMANLAGTAAVRVLDQRWTEDGALCLVMELLAGTDLEQALTRLEAAGQRADPRWLLELFGPVVRTLEAAHAAGIVHRDLKPANVFVIDPSAGGGVRLLDFGFAKFVRMRGLTQPGQVAGSPSYIAPETWQGRTREIDHRVDVYSLGAVLFRALAGRPPFVAQDLPELLALVTGASRPSLRALRPDLPHLVDQWVVGALAIDPEKRFQTVTALFNALGRVLSR